MLEIRDIYDIAGHHKNEIAQRLKRKIGKDSFPGVLEKTIESDKKTAANSITSKRVIDKKLMDACLQMESLFVSKMLKEMRNTVHKNKLFHGGFAEEIFEDMLYDEYSLNLSKTADLGLAKMLYKELSRNK